MAWLDGGEFAKLWPDFVRAKAVLLRNKFRVKGFLTKYVLHRREFPRFDKYARCKGLGKVRIADVRPHHYPLPLEGSLTFFLACYDPADAS